MKFNKLNYKELEKLLNFTLDYFKQDINYKVSNQILEGKLIESLNYFSIEDEGFIIEGIEINEVSLRCVAYNIDVLTASGLNYKDFKYRELLTHLTIWGLQSIYEVGYLQVTRLTSQKSTGWGISDIN